MPTVVDISVLRVKLLQSHNLPLLESKGTGLQYTMRSDSSRAILIVLSFKWPFFCYIEKNNYVAYWSEFKARKEELRSIFFVSLNIENIEKVKLIFIRFNLNVNSTCVK